MENYHKINTICLFILTSIAVAFVLSVTKVILIPFTLAIFISLVYSPFIQFIQTKFKINKYFALFISTLSLVLLLGCIAIVITKSVDSFIAESDQYREKFNQSITMLTQSAKTFGVAIDSKSVDSISEKLPVGKLIKGISGGLLGLLSNTFLVLFFTLFLITGESMAKSKIPIFEEIKKSAGRYIQTKIFTSATTALLSYVVLALFKVEMAFMFAIITFCLNFIPNIGSIIAVILTLPIIYLQFGFGVSFIAAVVLLGAIQIIIGNIMEPKMMGDSMGLHPVTILLFLSFWGYIWGITGMFLSVPITATLKIIFEKFELTKPIANLFSGKIELS